MRSGCVGTANPALETKLVFKCVYIICQNVLLNFIHLKTLCELPNPSFSSLVLKAKQGKNHDIAEIKILGVLDCSPMRDFSISSCSPDWGGVLL